MLKLFIAIISISSVLCQQTYSDDGRYRPSYAQPINGDQSQGRPQPQPQPRPQSQPLYNSQFSYGGDNSVTTPRPQPYHPPAQVHYVNIGPKLEGDYKFGYDTGKGPAGQSFREEVRLPDGTVQGAYGYLDAGGKMRIVKYTAGKEGFKVDSDTPAPGQGEGSRPAQAQPQYAPQPRPQAPPQRPPPTYDAIPPQHSRQQQSYGPPRLPPHALAQLQAFNAPRPIYRPQAQAQPRPQPQFVPQPAPQQPQVSQYSPQAVAQYRPPSQPRPPPNYGLNPQNQEEVTTWGPPVIPVALLNYNIGTRNGR